MRCRSSTSTPSRSETLEPGNLGCRALQPGPTELGRAARVEDGVAEEAGRGVGQRTVAGAYSASGGRWSRRMAPG